MLTSLRIQNFRSIRDATVKLGQVNLFIGPNNSGKSNFLKGIELLVERIINYGISFQYDTNKLARNLRRSKIGSPLPFTGEIIINFQFKSQLSDEYYDYKLLHSLDKSAELTCFIIDESGNKIPINLIGFQPQLANYPITFKEVRYFFINSWIYKPDPSKFVLSAPVSEYHNLNGDGSNLVSFLFDISQNNRPAFEILEADFANCVGDLVRIGTPADPQSKGNIKLKFFDKNNYEYWAEEVSEGVLYFLALLCIVHQPNPPKLLLLEEPEKGIHPRRIKEVMDFIFELARLRDIQIILTSHSPYVVDHFADIPECISVFDRENGETMIHNAGDIITETNAKLEAEGKKPIRYTDALGEHWVSGFLGGVPA